MLLGQSLRIVLLGLISPSRVVIGSTRTALSVFALSVVLIVTSSLVAAYIEPAPVVMASRNAGNDAVSHTNAVGTDKDIEIDLSSPQRVFTMRLGVSIVRVMISTVLIVGLLQGMLRFLTDIPFTFTIALGAVSATSLLEVLRTVTYAVVHWLTDSVRWGLHLGVVVDPAQQPILHAWLQHLDPLIWWQYVAMAIIACVQQQLHPRYGLVIGTAVFAVAIIIIGGIALVGWLMQSQVA